MSKNILIISPFFHPEPISTAKYNTALAQELSRYNCSVSVLCSHPLYPLWKPEKTKNDLPRIEIIRGGANVRYPKNPILRRAILEIWFNFYTAKFILSNRNRFDIIISIIPPSLYSFFIHKAVPISAKKITIVHDLQSVYAEKTSGNKGRLLANLIGSIEKRLLNHSNKIIFLSETMRKKALENYNLKSYNCFISYPFISISSDDSDALDLSNLFDDQKFNIVYSGALGEKQNPEVLLEYCHQIVKSVPDIAIKIFSAGPIYEELKNKYSAQNEIKFHDLVPEKDLLNLYRLSNLQLIPQIEGSNEGSIPSKLPNLLISGAPILALCEENSELAKILDRFKQSYTINKWDYSLFENRIKQIITSSKADSFEKIAADRMKNRFIEKFKIEILLNLILNNENDNLYTKI